MSKSIRINKQRGYTVIPNGLLPEGNISARAWGIYAYLLSRPDGWVIHVRQLQKVFTEGREAIYTAMRQLRDAGLLEMESYKEPGMPPKQRFVMADMEELLRKSPDTDSWDTGNRDTGNRDTGFRGLNHDLLKTNKENSHLPTSLRSVEDKDLNQNPRLSDVSLSSAENDFSGEEEDEKNVEEIKNQIFKSLGMKRRKAS